MAKFARACLQKVKTLTADLAGSGGLGEDTLKLAFRVGLHSGPVTGGVLKGDKARFQLFGDTVNTAARMESHGIRGKIHVSMATAGELIRSKKSGILVERKEKIHAKGKGYLQTYFLSDRFVNKGAGSGSNGSLLDASETTRSSSESNLSGSIMPLSQPRGSVMEEESSSKDVYDFDDDMPYAATTMDASTTIYAARRLDDSTHSGLWT